MKDKIKNNNVKIKVILIIAIIIIFSNNIYGANDLYFKLNQTEYYFLVGENGFIPLNTVNNYNQDINGLLTYTIAQSSNQNGVSYSSKNSNSQSFQIKNGENTINLGVGQSNSPATIDLTITYDYTSPNNTNIQVTLPKIKIFFVEKQEDKKNSQNNQQSSSKTEEEIKQEEQKAKEEAMKKQQKDAEEAMANQQRQNQMQNKLQNNQMNQNTEDIRKEMQKNEEMKKAFAENLAKKPELQQMNQELMNKGYNISNYEFNPENNETGEFKIDYKNQNGENASITGSMKNNSINKIEMKSSEEEKRIIDAIKNDPRYTKYDSNLKNEKYENLNYTINKIDNTTFVEFEYLNKNNETAKITAEVKSDKVEKVELKKNSKNNWIFLAILILTLIIIIIFFILKRKKQTQDEIKDDNQIKIEEIIDYKKLSKELLIKSRKDFETSKFKDAYEKISQSVRIYSSYDNDIKRETTSYELIKYLKQNKKDYHKIEEILKICEEVEFARNDHSKKEFEKIYKETEKIISN